MNAMLEQAAASAGGPEGWRRRKIAEAGRLVDFARRAGARRMAVLHLDLREALRAVIGLSVPVPMEPDPAGRPRVAWGAIIGIRYLQLALTEPLPGYAFANLLSPGRGAFHPNIATGSGQCVCLGAKLPTGIPVTELVLLVYGALAMQSLTIDPVDPAGVMNRDAALWWQAHTDLLPLSREPFFVEEQP